MTRFFKSTRFAELRSSVRMQPAGTTEKGDLDFLVDFERPTYDNFLGPSKDLERLFGRKVDILTPRGLDSIRVKSIAESIRKTLAYV
jgi:uncharacterized protein